MAESRHWNKLALESVAIVLSILLAFSIDAWWGARGDQKARLTLLQRLHADFEAIKPELKSVEEEHVLRQRAAGRLLAAVSVGDAVPINGQFDDNIAFTFIGSRTFQPGTGAVDAFVNGEGARLINNGRLADLLLSWPGLVEELQEEEQRLLAIATERWTPFLASRTDLAPFVAVFQRYNPQFGTLPDELFTSPTRLTLEADQEFLNIALERFTYESLARRDVALLIDVVDEILVELTNGMNNAAEFW